MRKIFLMLLVISMLFFNSGCLLEELTMTDSDYENECMDKLMSSLDDQNSQILLTLFAKNAIKNKDEFFINAGELFSYYQGKYLSRVSWGTSIRDHISYGEKTKMLFISCDIVTERQEYRIAVKYCALDDFDEDNVGIWSMYIIKKEDDTDLEYAYRGNDKYTEGINIGIKNVID